MRKGTGGVLADPAPVARLGSVWRHCAAALRSCLRPENRFAAEPGERGQSYARTHGRECESDERCGDHARHRPRPGNQDLRREGKRELQRAVVSFASVGRSQITI